MEENTPNSTDKSFKSKAKEQWLKMRAQYEELELQMALGKMEAKDTFKNQKERFTSYIDQLLEEVKDEKDENIVAMRTRLEELKVQLALGKMEAKDEYAETKAKLDAAINNLLEACKKSKSKSADTISEMATSFRTRLDIFKMHFALGKMEARDEINEEKEKMKERMQKVREKLDELEDAADEKWDDAKEFISENFNEAKNKIKGWFKRNKDDDDDDSQSEPEIDSTKEGDA